MQLLVLHPNHEYPKRTKWITCSYLLNILFGRKIRGQAFTLVMNLDNLLGLLGRNYVRKIVLNV